MKGSQNQPQSRRNGDLSEVYQRVPHFGRNDYTTESERLKTREERGDHRKFYCFGSSLRYKKGVQFCSWYMKGVPFW